MKNLVLQSLLLVGIASQATGCIITSGDDDGGGGELAVVTAEWSFRDVRQDGSTAVETDCPAGFNTVAMYNQEIDRSGRPVGSPIIDLFDCIDFRHDSAPLPATVYETWLEVTTNGGGSVYAQSLAAEVDVVNSDKTFKADIVNNGGYFQLGWDLRDAGGRALDCADVAELDGIEIHATLQSDDTLITDQFDCERGFDVTAALIEGSYAVSINAFQDGPNDVSISDPTNLPTQIIRDRNQVTELGTVTIVIP